MERLERVKAQPQDEEEAHEEIAAMQIQLASVQEVKA